MQLTSVISPYDVQWPRRYRKEAARLRPVFGSALQEIHHIGSTAVPGLAAKPEIDVLAVVDEIARAEQWTEGLTALRYRRGGDLSNGHLFYKRDVNGVRTHKVHVCKVGHPQIRNMLTFRDYLRAHEGTRHEYEQLKLALEKRNTTGIAEYLQGKEPFVRAVLRKLALHSDS